MLPDLPAVLSPGFRGCVHIVRDGQPLLTRASGYADLANQIPNTPATRFASASAGKAFVAVGILQLIQSGRLSPEDTLGRLLDLDLGRIDPHVTVRQLLTHTSGVPDYFDESVMDDYEALWRDFPNYRVRKNADLLPLFTDKPMAEPPGARFRYNNSGYVLLALVLEAVTGRLRQPLYFLSRHRGIPHQYLQRRRQGHRRRRRIHHCRRHRSLLARPAGRPPALSLHAGPGIFPAGRQRQGRLVRLRLLAPAPAGAPGRRLF